MTAEINPIYRQFFPENGGAPADWQPFNKYEAMRQDFSECDFAIRENKSWCDTAKAIALIVLKIIVLPWILYEAAKALLGRIAMLVVYPAQFVFTKARIDTHRIDVQGAFRHEALRGFVKREVVLEKNGQKYNGVLLGHEANNGKWALFAVGNCMIIEQAVRHLDPYLQSGFNVLMVNGPGVGKSEGLATVDRIGDAQEVGLRFLEEAVRARKIVMAGHSLGGAAIGLAALQHEFKPNVDYLAIRMMTFDRLSDLAGKIQGWIAGTAIRWLDCEMDSVKASKKFQENGIHEVVIQAQHDEIMAPSSLLDRLEREGLMNNKTGIVVPEGTHCELPEASIAAEIQRWDRAAPAVAE